MTDFIIPCEDRHVTLLACSETRKVRQAYNTKVRKAFRKAHKAPAHYQIHHILPIALGGDNCWLNLCLINPELHCLIHKYLDKQTAGMAIDERRKVSLPMLAGSVWHMPKVYV